MADIARTLEGLNVLVVEDEALVALNLETMLEDLGCRITGPVMRLDGLEELLNRNAGAVDAAILDVNIGGREVFAHATRLFSLGVPIVFATGYGRSGLPEAWHGWPVLQKPYSLEEIASGLRAALEWHHAPRHPE